MPKKTLSDKVLAYSEGVDPNEPVPVMTAVINYSESSVTGKARFAGLKLKISSVMLCKNWSDYTLKAYTHDITDVILENLY